MNRDGVFLRFPKSFCKRIKNVNNTPDDIFYGMKSMKYELARDKKLSKMKTYEVEFQQCSKPNFSLFYNVSTAVGDCYWLDLHIFENNVKFDEILKRIYCLTKNIISRQQVTR